jgi:hypothetical protein
LQFVPFSSSRIHTIYLFFFSLLRSHSSSVLFVASNYFWREISSDNMSILSVSGL